MQPTRVLKAHDARNLGSRAIFNYEDIRKRCDESVETAQKQAREILDKANREAEAMKRSAHASGLASGKEAAVRDVEAEIERRAREIGEKLCAEKLQTTLPAMLAAVSALDRERDRWLADWEAFGVRLSAAIAAKILRRELDLHPENVIDMLGETLRLAAGSTNIFLRLHPDDVQLMGDHPEELTRSMSGCAETAIVPDESISRGGCVIESQHGVIDARIDTQLERIVDELLQTGNSSSAGKSSSPS